MNLDVFGLTDNEYVILQALHATISKTPLTRKESGFKGHSRDTHLVSPVYNHRQGRHVYPLTADNLRKLLKTNKKLTWSYEPLVGAYIDVEGSNERYGVLVSGNAVASSYILAQQAAPSAYYWGDMGKTYVIGHIIKMPVSDMMADCSTGFHQTYKLYMKIVQEYVPQEGDITLMDIPKPHELLAVAGGFGTYPDIPDPFESAKTTTNKVPSIEKSERVDWVHPEAKKTMLSWILAACLWLAVPVATAVAGLIAGKIFDNNPNSILLSAFLTFGISALLVEYVLETRIRPANKVPQKKEQ